MTLMDERFGSELVTATGKVYVFDSIECLASFALDFTDEVHSLWVTNFRAPSQLVRVEEAFFVKSPLLKSPMGMGLVAFGEGMTPEDAVNSFAGEVLDWDGVLGLVAVRGGSSHGHPAPESMAGH
jgi:copper chaperone NosL